MKRLLQVLVALAGTLFLVMGLRWIVDPAGAAAAIGMPLLDGVARSSQIGDVGALFLSIGIMSFIALVTARRIWFYAPALILALAAILRLLSWSLHGAPLALDLIGVEVIVSALLLFGAYRLSRGH